VPAQLDFLRGWGEDAYGVGEECLRRAKALGGPNHIRRLTDTEAKAPFDCYHYRIIWQTVRLLHRGKADMGRRRRMERPQAPAGPLFESRWVATLAPAALRLW
jgi:hypothetical protein